MRRFLALVLLLLVVGVFGLEGEVLSLPGDSGSPSDDDWRQLQPNETVPRGSHVRLDMTSGAKWLKTAPPPRTRGEQILEVLQADDSLLDRIAKIRAVDNKTEFEVLAVGLWDERQSALKLDALTPAQRLLRELAEDPSSALGKLDEMVEEIDFAKQFSNVKGLDALLVLVEDSSASLEKRNAALVVLAKAVKWMPELQDEMFGKQALGRVRLLARGLDPNKQVMFYGAVLRGSGDAGSKRLLEQVPTLLAELKQQASVSTDAKLKKRTKDLVDDLEVEGFR